MYHPLGIALITIGVTSLFILRIVAMFAGWAPRGAAWARAHPKRLMT